MCCFNKVNLSEILLVHKRIINKYCTVKNNNEDWRHVSEYLLFLFNSRYFRVLFYFSTYIFNGSLVNDCLTNINANHRKIVHMYYKYRQ